MFKELIGFGLSIADTDIAMVACRLYRDALAPSSKITYKTGVNHLHRFTKKYPKVPLPYTHRKITSKLSLSLVFFAAYLFEIDSIKTYSTIRNYMSHVRQFYIKKGYPKNRFDSSVLKAVMRGIQRCMPPKADSRVAFLLIHYHIPKRLKTTRSFITKKAFAATSFGFFAMLRFHSYGKFSFENLTLVLRRGKEFRPSEHKRRVTLSLMASNCVVGF